MHSRVLPMQTLRLTNYLKSLAYIGNTRIIALILGCLVASRTRRRGSWGRASMILSWGKAPETEDLTVELDSEHNPLTYSL